MAFSPKRAVVSLWDFFIVFLYYIRLALIKKDVKMWAAKAPGSRLSQGFMVFSARKNFLNFFKIILELFAKML